jgi:hypothetical protein
MVGYTAGRQMNRLDRRLLALIGSEPGIRQATLTRVCAGEYCPSYVLDRLHFLEASGRIEVRRLGRAHVEIYPIEAAVST